MLSVESVEISWIELSWIEHRASSTSDWRHDVTNMSRQYVARILSYSNPFGHRYVWTWSSVRVNRV